MDILLDIIKVMLGMGFGMIILAIGTLSLYAVAVGIQSVIDERKKKKGKK